ncbi:caspase family protein [Acinetobacter pittii]|uniref:caspase family protein n=1 Tax=Acinetobacter pittii TaxID=48296 RepID=UPI00300AB61A
MKNLAILIGVADYQYINKLSPCDRDVDLISNILDISGKYQDILLLDRSPISSIAKDQIAEFVRLHQEDDIDEIFIYYTGHGARIKDDFFYLFADFNEQRLEQTSLRNSEFDAMLKSLKPKLTVKVIDACQAGTEYIKSNQELQLIFDKSSKESFNKAYFLFSSSSVESSVALQDFSVFTKSFAKSLLSVEGQNIRYRDVMAYISDDPNVKKHQTPLFIQQADNTEIFINISEEIIEVVSNLLNQNTYYDELKDKEDQLMDASTDTDENDFLSSLVKKVKNRGEDFCNEEEAQESINQLKIAFLNYEWAKDISEHLFDIELEFNATTPYLESKTEIADWISESEEDYFTKLNYTQESYEVDVPDTNLYRMVAGGYRTVTKYRDVLNGYRLTAPSPFQTLIIQFKPKEQILNWYKGFITLIFSKSKLTIFYKFEREKEKNWSERFIEEQNEWKTVDCSLKKIDEIHSIALQVMKDIEIQIISDIQSLID